MRRALVTVLIPEPHAQSAHACLVNLGSGLDGLSTAEAARRLAAQGPNLLPQAAGPGLLRRFAAQFHHVLIYVLLCAAAVTGFLQHWVDTGVIVAVVLVNALMGFVQEGKAESAMAAIRSILAPRATVLRDGRRMSVDGADLVVGDVVMLEAGDKVPADLRVLQARGLSAQEAILTGESIPVDKRVDAAPGSSALGDRHSMLWSGTLITQGVGQGLVVATGRDTEIGRIGGLLAGVERVSTPLVAQMDEFARWLSMLILTGALLLLVYGYFVGHHPFDEMFMTVVGLAVAAIPEGLPAVMTITLAIGVKAMARRHAIVRKLPAIESIGSVSVICTDKTGTLTRQEMVVTDAETPEGCFTISGDGYAPRGNITPEGDLTRLASAATLCNDAALRCKDGRWLAEGDPMEAALLAFAAKVQTQPVAVRLDVIPFDSRHQFMAVLSEDASGRFVSVKGAPERVLRMCHGIDQRHWHAAAAAMAGRGLRVIALATSASQQSSLDMESLDGRLVLLGLLGLLDPPRPEAAAAVAECHAAGIQVKMITGDHAGTARAIATQVGLGKTLHVLTGADLESLDDAQLAAQVACVDVFARTSPEHKLRLVTALQAIGLTVAMTGDGVNDAPALKRADVGIAMGVKGSDAAKEAAEMVLGDDNFATIVAAVREGRRVWDNLKKVISWTLPTNAGEAAVLVLALLFGLALPVTAVQILWVNLVTAITLGLALAFEPAEVGSMRRPPRPRRAPVLTAELVWHVILVASLFAAAVFGVFQHSQDRGDSLAKAQTMAMNTLVALEIFHLFFIRNLYGTTLDFTVFKGNPMVWGVVLIVSSAQLIVTQTPLCQQLLGTETLSLTDGLLILMVGVSFFTVIEIEKRIRRSLKSRPDGPP